MLRILSALIVIVAGIQAIPPEVDHMCAKLDCKLPEKPPGFPQTAEDLQKICEPTTTWLECNIRYQQRCMNPDPEELELANSVLRTINDICSEDSLLNAAIVDNLQCFNRLIKNENERRLCPEYETKHSDHVEKFADSFIEEGLVSLNRYENDTDHLHYCIDVLDVFACSAMYIEEECGTVAMAAFIEVATRLGPAHFDSCADFYEFLPAMIQLHRLEKEKSESIAETFRKR